MNKLFADVACIPGSLNWDKFINREKPLYERNDDLRSPFLRDYTRILHSCAFRRLKHKTQVFFNIGNDHICTRMEHVLHVESVSSTIANSLGLNTDLTNAISIGHDLGHAPFGHQGELIIDKLSRKYIKQSFWHEKNSLRIVDDIELLEDYRKISCNLDLTYAVRDGLISHCGEINENGLKPRNDLLNLESIKEPNEYAPATWEGCVVKIADKIAYIGRDIEDANRIGFISESDQHKLVNMARENDQGTINTTAIMYNLIVDICKNSSPEKGICLSDKLFFQLNQLKRFNYESIYKSKRLEPFKKYSELILTQVFIFLFDKYEGKLTIANLEKQSKYNSHVLQFIYWLSAYCSPDFVYEHFPRVEKIRGIELFNNRKIYGALETKEIYAQAILDYISGMTDRYAIEVFNELITL